MQYKMKDKFGKVKVATILLIAIVLVVGVVIYFAIVPPTKQGGGLEFPVEKRKAPAELVIEQAQEMLRVGETQAAIEMMQSYLTKKPAAVIVRSSLAELHLMLNQIAPAGKQIEDILKISPNNPRGLWMKGMLANADGKDPTVYFSRAATQPDAGKAIWGMYGLWLIDRSNTDQAKVYLNKALGADSRDPKVFMALGQIAFSEDKYENAIELLQSAIRISPDDPQAWAILADVQKNIGRPLQAVVSLEQALRLAKGPVRGNLLMQLGMARIVCEQWPGAAEVFEQATRFSQVQKQAYIFAARSHYFAQQYDQAAENIDKAWELSPGHAEVKKWRERIAQRRPGEKKKNVRKKPTSLFDSLPSDTEEKLESSEDL